MAGLTTYEQTSDDSRSGPGYRLNAHEVVRKGRRRELWRTIVLMSAFSTLMWLLRLNALGFLSLADDLKAEVPARLSVLVGAAVVVTQLLVAYRAWGLARSQRVDHVWLRGARFSVAAVFVGVALETVINLWFWFSFDTARPMSLWYFVGAELISIVALILVVAIALGAKRRDQSAGPPMTLAEPPEPTGTVICCSGGGIRASAFCLGGLQELQRRGIYSGAAAVVGVSGGGYIAAAHHVLRWRSPGPGNAANATAERADWHQVPPAFAPGTPEVQWLRRSSRYLLDSAGALVQAVLSLAYGIAVNLLLIIVAIGSAAWLLAWLFLASGRLHLWQISDETPVDKELREALIAKGIGGSWGTWWPVGWVWILPALGVALFLLEKAIDRFGTIKSAWVDGLRLISRWLIIGGGLLAIAVLVVPSVVSFLSEYAATDGTYVGAVLHRIGFVPDDVCRSALEVNLSACGVTPTPNDGTAALSAGSVSSTKAVGGSVAAVVAAVAAVLASARSAGGDDPSAGWRGLLNKVWAKIKDPLVPYAAITVIAIVGLVSFLREVARLVTNPDFITKWSTAITLAILLIAARVFTDANRTSLHHYFRERISRAFLLRRTKAKVEPVDYRIPLRFSAAKPPRGGGPRLVSCAVANVTDADVVPSKRGCTPFIFDHARMGLTDALLPAGAARRKSKVYEFAADDRFRDATIPAVVAISAAAFSPLAGRENVRLGPYRAVLALANARLGVWLPNPIWVDELILLKRMISLGRSAEAEAVWEGMDDDERAYARQYLSASAIERVENKGPWPEPTRWQKFNDEARCAARGVFKKPGMFSLVREAFGQASVYDRFLYVTDGGHYDNLGLVEALRRRPERIFVLDASNDPEDTFRALGHAIATARMDLDCEVDIDPRGMRRTRDGRSESAHCIGSYKYNKDRSNRNVAGRIYLAKAIMCDGLPWDVETYANDNREFPRTSTGNQFYSEFDFEAYRELGVKSVAALLKEAEFSS